MTSIPLTARDQDLFVSVLLDRSGSMEPIREATIDAFNGFIYELRMDTGRSLVTLTQFDSESTDVIHDAVDAASVAPLTRETFQPRARTPLFDATGTMLARTEHAVAAAKWEGSVLVVIITDGMENASREWSGARITERVKDLEARGWGFVYLGAHAEAYAQADALGIAKGSQARWDHSRGGARDMGYVVAQSAKGMRTKVRTTRDLILEEERAMMERSERERARRR